MTGHQIDNFVGSLVEMAKAFEERPALHDRIHGLEGEVSRVNNDNQALRDSNDILRRHIITLESKIAEVTKERDDAGFRCLEADDKAARILDLARTLASGLGQVIAEVEPPKPQEPVTDYVVPMHVTTQEPVSVQQDPISTTTSEPVVMAHVDTPSLGQSEPGFTTHATSTEAIPSSAGTAHDTSEPVPSDSAGSTADKLYTGKRYRDMPNYIPLSDWLAGGGAEVDYWT